MTNEFPHEDVHPQTASFFSLLPKPNHQAPSTCALETYFRDIWDNFFNNIRISFIGLSAKKPDYDPLQAETGGNDYCCKLYANFKDTDGELVDIAIYLGALPYPDANGEFVLSGNRYIFPIYLRTAKQYREMKDKLTGKKADKPKPKKPIKDQTLQDDERKTENLHIVLFAELLLWEHSRKNRLRTILKSLQKEQWEGDISSLRSSLRGWLRSGTSTSYHKFILKYGRYISREIPLNRYLQRKEMSFYGLGGDHPDNTKSFHIRDVDDDDLYRICPVVTPQGHKVGMRLFLARRARIDPIKNCFLAPDQPEPGDSLSDAASLIPFIEHDDASRALMGANMLKQALALKSPDEPWIQTGWERELAKLSEFPSNIVVNGVLALGKNLFAAYLPWGLKTFEDGIVISESAATALTSVEEKTFWFDQNKNTILEGDFCEIKILKAKNKISESEKSALNDEGIVRVGRYVKPGDVLVSAQQIRFRDINKTKLLDVLNADRDIEALLGKEPDEVRNVSLRLPPNFKGSVVEIIDLNHGKCLGLPASIERRIGVKIQRKEPIKLGDKIASRHGAKGVVVDIIHDRDMPFVKTKVRHCNDSECRVEEPHRHVQVILNPLGVTGRLNLGQLFETTLAKVAEIEKRQIVVTPFVNEWTLDHLSKTLTSKGLQEDGKEQLYLLENGGARALQYTSLVGPQYFLKLIHQADGKIQGRGVGWPFDYTIRDNQPRSGKRVSSSGILGSGQRVGEMETWALAGHGAWHLLDDLLNVKSDDRRLLEKVKDPDFNWNESRRPQAFLNLILVLRSMGFDLQLLASDDDVTDAFFQNRDGVPFDKVSLTFATSEKIKQWGCGGTIQSIDLYAQKKEDQRKPLDKFYPDPDGLFSRTIFDPRKPWQMGLIKLVTPILHPIMEDYEKKYNKTNYMIENIAVLPPPFRIERLVQQKYFQNTLNKLYCKVLAKNNRLKKLLDMGIQDENLIEGAMGGLKIAVQELFLGNDGPGRKIKGLIHILSKKRGLLRRHLAGKRTDFSGRSVIIGDPAVGLNEVGLPSGIWDKLLPDISIKEKPLVILNRQPSLHRNSIQAFRAFRHLSGDVIRLNPYVCRPFNADFDGDTIAVHVPCKPDAILEAEKLLPVNNLLSQANGKMVLGFDKDIALAAAYLTYDVKIETDELVPLTTEKALPLNGRHFLEKQSYNRIETTVGRLLLRRLFEKTVIKNRTMSISNWNEALQNLTDRAMKDNFIVMEEFTDRISLLFDCALKQSGLSLSLKDFKVFKDATEKESPSMLELMRQCGKYNRDLEWQITKNRGKMRRPGRDNVLTDPITSNLLGGHNEKEYLVSAHGARAGLVDKGLITAHSGHLLRDWIYLLQHLIIVQADCKAAQGLNADTFIEDQHQISGTRYDVTGNMISKIEPGLIFRSPWSCMAEDEKGHPGVCQKCYGKDPATGKLPDIGLPVGILAAQALGERISQETLKSFHSGGTEQEGTEGLTLVKFVRKEFKIESEDAAIVSEKLCEIMSHFSAGSRPALIHFEVVLRGYRKEKRNSGFLGDLSHSQAISTLRNIAIDNRTDNLHDVIGRIVTGQLVYVAPRRKIDV